MKSVDVSRKVKFRVRYDETIPSSRAFVMSELRDILKNRSYPIPFGVSGHHATFGSYEITRIW